MLVNARHLAPHLRVGRYGDFLLTEAVRLSAGLPVVPRQGYRRDTYRDPNSRRRLRMLTAAVSAERLFDVFLELLEPLGDVVDVVLETSHDADADRHSDLRRTHIDRPVLASYCCDFERLLLHDGCTGLAVLSRQGTMEVQFDEHKLLTVYANKLAPFRRVLRRAGVPEVTDLRFVFEAEHWHSSDPEFREEFRRLCHRLGVGALDRVMSDEE
jgi:hypothetical protein